MYFEYDDKSGNYVAEYRGLTVKAILDQFPENPWSSWDCLPDIAVLYPDGINTYGEGKDEILTAPTLTRQQIKDNVGTILQVTGYRTLLELITMETANHLYRYEDGVEAVNDAISYWCERENKSNLLEGLQYFHRMAGNQAYCGTTNGYSQGDWAEVLVVVTPEFKKKCGITEPLTDLESYVDLYGAWAWSDVYGYAIEDQDGEHLTSCWGFYGSDFKESGLEESVINAADSEIFFARKTRLKKIRELMRAHVPLTVRQHVIKEYPRYG